MNKNLKQEILEANRYVHSKLVETGEYQKSPHFRPENIAKVREHVIRLRTNIAKTNSKAVDFGCGTGFMIDVMKDLFSEIHGVDITQAMMQQVDTSAGNIFLHEAMAEQTPFNDAEFDFATAYSFMDHLHEPEDFLKEVYRVLKAGGTFYSGLNPSRDFIVAMDDASRNTACKIPPVVEREIRGALHNGAYYAENFGIDSAMLEKAEPMKSDKKGFDAEQMIAMAKHIGFTECRVEYEWFLGQGKVMHEQSFEAANAIDSYLTSVLPVTRALYKYLNFIFIK